MPSPTTVNPQAAISHIAPAVFDAHEPRPQTQYNSTRAPSQHFPSHITSSSDAVQDSPPPESTAGIDRNPHPQIPSEGRRPHSPKYTEYYPSMTVIMSQHGYNPSSLGHSATSPLSSPHSDVSSLRRSRFASRSPPPRARVTSCEHGRHYKCSPDCSAALAPYNLLTAAIGRASAMDMRRAATKASSEPPSPNVRPSLQSRRSRQGTPTTDLPSPSHGLLTFDRKQWEVTPPLPHRELFKDQEGSGGYFSDYLRPSDPTAALEEVDPRYGLELPRSSSAPAVALMTLSEHSPSDASVKSSGTSQHIIISQDTGGVVPASQRLHEALQTHVRPLQHDMGVDLSRFATVHRKKAEEKHRYGPHGRSVGGTSDFEGQLSPELATILGQRLSLNHHSQTVQKEELLNEGNWSFDTSLAEIIHLALRPELLSWKASSPCSVAE